MVYKTKKRGSEIKCSKSRLNAFIQVFGTSRLLNPHLPYRISPLKLDLWDCFPHPASLVLNHASMNQPLL